MLNSRAYSHCRTHISFAFARNSHSRENRTHMPNVFQVQHLSMFSSSCAALISLVMALSQHGSLPDPAADTRACGGSRYLSWCTPHGGRARVRENECENCAIFAPIFPSPWGKHTCGFGASRVSITVRDATHIHNTHQPMQSPFSYFMLQLQKAWPCEAFSRTRAGAQ